MKVGIIQSNYIPWRGYFDFINQVDLFIVYDDQQFTKRDWRSRNKIKGLSGLRWLTVPVRYSQSSKQSIENTYIDYSLRWQNSHLNKFRNYYAKAPFLYDALNILESCFAYNDPTISNLNVRLTKAICEYLQINTQIRMSSEYEVAGSKTLRLISLLKKADATSYLSGPTAKTYLDERLFADNSIILEYKTYDYSPYQQLWGEFVGEVTILDLIANCGPTSVRYLPSITPNLRVVP